MRKAFLLTLAVLSGLSPAFSQTLLYEETFRYPGPSGNFPVSVAGWANAIPNNPQRLYQLNGNDGAVYAFQGNADVPTTTAFYTTTALDNGAFGMAFPAINPAAFVGLTFWVDIQPYYSPAHVVARFAVQMNSSNWYAASTPLPVPVSVGGFSTYSQAFTPSASAWTTLTVSGTNATTGGPPSADLAGLITGAGMVFTHTVTNGTHNFDNFRVTATMGSLTASLLSTGAVNVAWPGGNGIGLRSSTDPAAGQWQDFTNTLGLSSAVLPLSAAQMFFRLATDPAAWLSLGQANLSFEADGKAVATPSGWTTSGNTNAASVISGNAYAGTFCLQHSNSTAYQVQTSVLITNLPNGYYRLDGYVKSSGGQRACYLAGNGEMTSLPALTNWTEMIVRGISVSNSRCLIQLYSDASASNWCRVDALSLTQDDIPYSFLKGGDISELSYVERGGGKFYETNGVAMDCLQILKNHGFNIVRLRLYNDPGNPNYSPSNLLPQGIQSPTNILSLAARAQAQGMQLELTFYYSDYWPNGIPHDWVGFSLPQLTNAVYNFTTNFMTQMRNQVTTPEYVSLGNEIDGGILLPVGSSANFSQLAQLLNAGYAGVKAVAPSTQVILHIGHVDTNSVQWFFNQCVANGVHWDIIGCSYYPFWSGLTSEQARTNINQFYPSFNKPVLIMETGYNWSTNCCDGWPGQLSSNGPEIYPSTQQGQKSFLLKCFKDLKLVTDGHCVGDLYWDPIFICVPGEGWQLGARNVVDNTTLFDFTGHALPSLDAFNYSN